MSSFRPKRFPKRRFPILAIGGGLLLAVGIVNVGWAQTAPNAIPQTVASPIGLQQEGMLKLNLAGEIELRVLADYVSSRLKMKILYDEEIANKKISIRAPDEVPTDSLLGLLQSALKMKGLALADAEVPG